MDMNSFEDELKSHLADRAASMGVESASVADVERRGRRRTRRGRAGGVVAVVAVVLVATVGIRPLITDDQSTLDVAAGATTTVAPTTTVGTAGRSTDSAIPSPPPPPLSQGEAIAAASSFLVGSDYSYGGGDWVVPWGDGFLSLTTVWDTPLLPGPDSELAALFPPEILEVVQEAGATTLNEAMAALQAAGLLEQATDLVERDPELMSVFQSLSVPGPARLLAQTSPDGVVWTDMEGFVPPPVGTSFSQVVSDGTHLVVAGQVWNDEVSFDDPGVASGDGSSTITVSVSTNLSDWEAVEIVSPSVDGPAYVQTDRSLWDLTIGPDGWLGVVSTNSYVDMWSLLPPEVREWQGGSGITQTPDGLEVELYAAFEVGLEAEFEPPPATTIAVLPGVSTASAEATGRTPLADESCCEPSETRFYSWSDLGVDPDEFETFRSTSEFASSSDSIWIGDWNGTPASGSVFGGPGDRINGVVGTDAGFLALKYTMESGSRELLFSADGLVWRPTEMPAGDPIESILAVDGGALVQTRNQLDLSIWRGAADGTGWTKAEVPAELTDAGYLNGFFGASRGLVAVIDTRVYTDLSQPPVEFDVAIEQDGQSIHLFAHDDGTADLVITDLATGEVVADLNGNYGGLSADFVRISDPGDFIEIVDDGGNVLVSIPMDVILEVVLPAQQDAMDASDWVPPPPVEEFPEFTLVATFDGIEWLAVPLDSDAGSAGYVEYPSSMGINGDNVVLRRGGTWESYTIG